MIDTVNWMAWVFAIPPPVAVMVGVELLAGALGVATRVSVVEPPPGAAMPAGAKLAVTPLGSPLIENVIAALNPFANTVVSTIRVDPPRTKLTPAALAARVKPGAGTVKLMACVRVIPPPAADTVSVEAPGITAEPTESVSVLCPLPGAAMVVGLKVAVTPLGSPMVARDRADLNPAAPVAVTVMDPTPPRATVRLEALSERVKAGTTERLKACVLVTPPPTAETVSVAVTAVVVAVADSVKVLLPAPVAAMFAGAKLAVTPAGSPAMDMATVELNPLTRVVVNPICAVPPGARLTLATVDASVKLGVITVRPRVCVLVRPPPKAVMVRLKAPGVAPAVAERVNTLLPAPGEAMLEGAKTALIPDGRPAMDMATADLKPLTPAIVSVAVVVPPGARLTVDAFDDNVKLGIKMVRARD